MINQNCPWLVSSLETISTSNAAFSPASPMISLSSTNPYEFDTKQERKMHQTSFYVQQLYIEDTRVTQSGKTWKLSKMTNFHLTAKTDRTCCATLVGFYGHAGPNSWSHTTNKVQQEPLKINSIWPERTQRECGNPSAVTERKHKASHVEPWIKHENTTPTDDTRKLLDDFDFDLDQQQQITCSVRGQFLLSNKPFYTYTPSVIDDFPPSQLKFKWFAIKSQEEKETAAVMLYFQRNKYGFKSTLFI